MENEKLLEAFVEGALYMLESAEDSLYEGGRLLTPDEVRREAKDWFEDWISGDEEH